MENSDYNDLVSLPLLPLRDVVVYPHMVIPLFVGREKSITALNRAMELDKKIFLVAQKNASEDDPSVEDIYEIGTIATILQLLKLPDGTVKVLVEGEDRAELKALDSREESLMANAEVLTQERLTEREEDALVRTVMSQFDKYVQLSKKVPSEVLTSLASIEDPGRLADTIAAHMSLKINEKQEVLEITSVRERLEHLMTLM